MMRSILAALAVTLTLAACAETREVPTPTPPPILQLNRTQWISTEGGLNAPMIEFVDSRANGYTGCNRFFAQIEQSGPALSFSGISTTRRACSPDLMALEQAFVSRLEGTRAAHIEGDVLVLKDVNGLELARFTRQP